MLASHFFEERRLKEVLGMDISGAPSIGANQIPSNAFGADGFLESVRNNIFEEEEDFTQAERHGNRLLDS